MTTPKKSETEPLDIRDEDVARFETDSELKGKDGEIYPDESMNLRARRRGGAAARGRLHRRHGP